jgi:hypothetical protein
MRFGFLALLLLLLLAGLTLASAGPARGGAAARAAEERGAKPLSEAEKIRSLIATVRGLRGATFIRNGAEHDCDSAADHMQRKWKAGRGEIKTARDFIRLAASKSSRSGEPYRIRFKDGTETTSEAFLTEELDKLEGKSDGKGES